MLSSMRCRSTPQEYNYHLAAICQLQSPLWKGAASFVSTSDTGHAKARQLAQIKHAAEQHIMSFTPQEYNYHLGAVNTVTFVDEGRRFVSTSDDKTIRVWEFGIPVQIKYIADPSLHSIPAVAVHPNKQWFIGTSLDNQIVTYAARDRFRQNRKKVFKVRSLQHLPSPRLHLHDGPCTPRSGSTHSNTFACPKSEWPAPDGRKKLVRCNLHTSELQHA